jgi:DNA-binding transcriptional LysR family regulator
MPAELVKSDLARGILVKIVAADEPPKGFVLSVHAVYRTDTPPGIAARWFIDRLKRASTPVVMKDIQRRRPTRRKRI